MIKLIKSYSLLISISVVILVCIGLFLGQTYASRERVALISHQEEIVPVAPLASTHTSTNNLLADFKDEAKLKEAEQVTHSENANPSFSQNEKVDHSTQESKEVPVYICGEVVAPGVYYVPIRSIIDDVLQLSGGLTEHADAAAINLASPIQSNQKIIIPKIGEKIDKLEETYDNINKAIQIEDNVNQGIAPTDYIELDPRDETRININTANKEALMTLSGIGEVKAQAIIAYREMHGAFKSIEAIQDVSGIGSKTYEKLAPFITI